MKKQPYSSEDSWLTDLISIVREEAEEYTGRSFLTQTRELVLSNWPGKDWFYIPSPPLQSISYVKYYGSDAVLNTFSTDDYIVGNVDNKYPGRVTLGYGEVWPTTTLYTSEPIRVRYISGYLAKANFMVFHRNIYQWMLNTIEQLYNNRGMSVEEVPHGALDRDKVDWL